MQFRAKDCYSLALSKLEKVHNNFQLIADLHYVICERELYGKDVEYFRLSF